MLGNEWQVNDSPLLNELGVPNKPRPPATDRSWRLVGAVTYYDMQHKMNFVIWYWERSVKKRKLQ